MKPALSVIFLTVVSGAGYGLLFWTGVLGAAGALPRDLWFGPAASLLALALAGAGLIASTFHLGRPERAWRAISQWRTSWLSREGVAALLTNIPALAFALAWGLAGEAAAITRALGLVAALAGVTTLICTAMIYASLKPIRQWRAPHVLPNYLMMAAASGAAVLAALAVFWPFAAPARLAAALAVLLFIAAGLSKRAYWRFIDTAPPSATIEAATGLGALGPVRMLDAPNTEENYLLREFRFVVGRRHAERLRTIALVLGFAVPAALAIAGGALAGPAGRVLLPLGAALALAGLFVERWLFFAQATHTVTLYYGAERA
ncbi:MAG TPA: DmsC/YnfH family molybdoenzyme membrane anchor subunit [Acetobacteraceae bacterium]|nr:DmsC/YnfH family molybdoenzyme membrane anchor subunit [Acetobacteraceae bacterium]